MRDQVVNQVLDLLDTERQALRIGDFDALNTLLDAKTQLFERLQVAAPGRRNLEVIQQKLSENQSLLSAAMQGVGAARTRLSALQNVRENLSTYDHNGQMAKLPTARPAITKKA